MATKQTVNQKTTGKQAKSPAQVLREQKAKIEEASKVDVPRMPTERHPASDAAEAAGRARDRLADMVVPMTLGEVCEIIGVDCRPERFAVTALETLGGQLDVLTELAESTEVGGYDAYRLTENIRQRMLLASRVTAWLETETATEGLPGVAP